MLLQTSLPLKAELTAIRIYQKIGSPIVRYMATCRYEPSCSHYAVHSLEQDGFWMGNWKIAKRLVMCSPVGFVVDSVRGEEPSPKLPNPKNETQALHSSGREGEGN